MVHQSKTRLHLNFALPLQQFVLCDHSLLGKWAEPFFWGDGVALALVVCGFGVYQRAAHRTHAVAGGRE